MGPSWLSCIQWNLSIGDTIGAQLAVLYTVEPLYSGHHWDPAGCSVQRGVPHLEVDFTQRCVAGTADSILREGSLIQRVIYCIERFLLYHLLCYTFVGGGVYVLIYIYYIFIYNIDPVAMVTCV